MAVVQNTYAPAIPNGYPGMVASGETSNRLSRSVEDAAGIPFGRAAFRGATDHGCTATPAAGKFMGITIANAGVVSLTSATPPDTYAQYSSAGLLNEGEIWVIASVNVSAGDPAAVTAAGAFTNVAGGNTPIPATFDDTVTAGSVVRLRVAR